MKPFPVLFLFLLFLQGACQWPAHAPQTGHQEIAAAVRDLLDHAYAGIDSASYRNRLRTVEAVSAEQLDVTPAHLHDQVNQMLGYLQTAEEILCWTSAHNNRDGSATTQPVTIWIQRYPFLQAAVGARAGAAEAFDPATALILLWDRTDEVLRGLQVKSRPL